MKQDPKGQACAIAEPEQQAAAPVPWFLPRDDQRRRSSLRLHDAVLILGVLAVVLAAHLTTDRVPNNHGFGWDGNIYGRMAQNFYQELFQEHTDRYHFQRILPSALVHYTLRLCHLSRSPSSIVCSFVVLNVVLISMAAWLWCLIANQLRISPRGKVLGAVALFGNFAVLKWASYYPVLTDIPAFTLGFLLLYLYLARRAKTLFLVSALGAFTWPTVIYLGMFLFVFPRKKAGDRQTSAGVKHRGNVLAALAGVLAMGLFFQLYLKRHIPSDAVQVIPSVIHLSMAIVLFYLFVGLGAILDNAQFFHFRYWLACLLSGRCLLALLLVVGIREVSQYYPAIPFPEHTFMTASSQAFLAACRSIERPGVFLVGHIAFFGPVILLALFCWKETCRLMRRHGTGLSLSAVAILLWSLTSESRQLINFFPMIVPFVIKAVDRRRFTNHDLALFGILAFLFSKVWLTINVPGIPEPFPSLLFMNMACWMTHWMYVVHGVVALLVGWLLYVQWYRSTVQRPEEMVPDYQPEG